MKELLVVFGLTLTLVFTACGGGDDTSDDSESTESVIDEAAQARLETEVESALKGAATAEETYFTVELTYTPSIDELEVQGLNISSDVTLEVPVADASTYCIEATHTDIPDTTFALDSESLDVTEGTC